MDKRTKYSICNLFNNTFIKHILIISKAEMKGSLYCSLYAHYIVENIEISDMLLHDKSLLNIRY